MLKVILISCSLSCSILIFNNTCTSQIVRKSITPSNNAYDNPKDSANIYYILGWNAYKSSDFGAARYYWDLGSNYNSNIPSKYSSAFRLGLMNQMGVGIGINYELAFYYYNLGYANGQSVGDVDATKNIASYYENGIFVKKDKSKALEWYLKAKVQGNNKCDNDIARIRKALAEGLED